MNSRTATIIGATGLIGSHLWELLKTDPYYDTIRLLVRRPFVHSDAKTEAKLIDFNDPESFKLGVYGSHAVFCAVGTTRKKTGGNKEAYRKVDYDIAVKAAQFCSETGCENYLLVSSVGASAKSKNFYLKLKGEIEGTISGYAISSISILRPSMLLGERKEKRTGERLAQSVMETFSLLIPAKYKPIDAADVAQSMISISKEALPGVRVYEYEQMKNMLSSIK